MHVVVLDGHAGGVRDCGTGAQFSLGGNFQFRTAHSTDAAIECGNFLERSCDACADVDVAEVLLSFCLDVVVVDSGADKPLAGQAELSGFFARGQLAADCVAVAGSAHLRVLLGNVELLLMAQMGLSHTGSAVPARVRNAVAGISGLHSVRA